MLEQLENLRLTALQEICISQSPRVLDEIRVRFLGKKGELTSVLKALSSLPKSEKEQVGQAANKIKDELAVAIKSKSEELADMVSVVEPGFDATRPGINTVKGNLHPITQIMHDLNDAFRSLGFEQYSGPEISSELYDFDSLNFPPEHPARESMDTYWLDGYEQNKGGERLCLRPHLTGASVRYMQTHKPPFRMIYPGRVFRNESIDASHERAFWQYEALIVEKSLPFAAGRLLIDTILSTVFGRKVVTRMRAGYFPFVEPGFEIDMRCLHCEGAGCRICKQVGWLEVMPGGGPHPQVMRAGGLDPEEWDGFYINIGLDRLVMMRFGIHDIRLLHSTDLRFLTQFG